MLRLYIHSFWEQPFNTGGGSGNVISDSNKKQPPSYAPQIQPSPQALKYIQSPP